MPASTKTTSTKTTSTKTTSTMTNRGLWVAQVLLAALFLFAGAMKFATPDAALAAQGPFPVTFIHFIGVCEILGALGLVLPWATGVARWLTPLAAEGLVIIMIGAVVTTLAIGGGAGAVVPAAVGALLVPVAVKRGHAAPRPTARRLTPASAR